MVAWVVGGGNVEEEEWELGMGQAVSQEMMAVLGGHWANALSYGEGVVLSLSGLSFLLLLLFGNMNICLIAIQYQAVGC